jgi:hypothetical protein
MGAVFFVVFLFILLGIGLILLGIFIVFLLLGLIGGHKHKKMYWFLLPAGICGLIGTLCTSSLFIYVGALKAMNNQDHPNDWSCDRSKEVSNPRASPSIGVSYQVIPSYHALFHDKGKGEAFCTYQSLFIYAYMNSGYYYRCTDTSLSYTLVTDMADDALFTKKEEVDQVASFYKAAPAHWWSSRTSQPLDSSTEAVDMDTLRKQEKVVLPYDDSEGNYMAITLVSEDGYVQKDYASVFKYTDASYYLKCDWVYGELGITGVEAIKLPEAFQKALALDATKEPSSGKSLSYSIH